MLDSASQNPGYYSNMSGIRQTIDLINPASYIQKLSERGHLSTLYQDLERIFEIEKETNKIECVLKNNKSHWKDYFYCFKLNFEVIANRIINDVFNHMMHQEEVKRDNNVFLQQKHDKENIQNRRQSNEGVTPRREPLKQLNVHLEEKEKDIFNNRKYSNKESIIKQLKKKHNFKPKAQASNSKSRQHKLPKNRSKSRSVSFTKNSHCESFRRSNSGSLIRNTVPNQESHGGCGISPTRDTFTRMDRSSRNSLISMPKKQRFPREPSKSPGPCHYNPSYISPRGDFIAKKEFRYYDREQDFNRVHRTFN
ncbi:unnamed protein product [Moneuplotes crassus]|uniref:Uncharacterized protein n=1 Tax=Euplotes crassus TaxID=5936 RepID=A0AAD2D289_EUPCR|nr:unnamed protein product [Moneuplotes crassus]